MRRSSPEGHFACKAEEFDAAFLFVDPHRGEVELKLPFCRIHDLLDDFVLDDLFPGY